MTLEDLRTFVAVCRAGSMSEAARQLGCTQGAVAQHVRRLERELGAELLSRLRRGVAPTEAGRRLYEVASASLADIEGAVREIVRSRGQREHRLRLAVSGSIAANYIRRAILELKERHPDAAIEIEPRNTAEERLDALREDRADLALVPLTDPLRSLETRPLSEVPLALLVHRDHPYARRKHLELADLASIRYIVQSPSSATYRHIQRALREAEVHLEPTRIDAVTAYLSVEIGAGETFVPARDAARFEASGSTKVVPVPSLPPIRMAWAARSFSLLPKVAAEFLEVSERIVREAEVCSRGASPRAAARRRGGSAVLGDGKPLLAKE